MSGFGASTAGALPDGGTGSSIPTDFAQSCMACPKPGSRGGVPPATSAAAPTSALTASIAPAIVIVAMPRARPGLMFVFI